MATLAASPRWDLTPFFPSVESPEFDASLKDLVRRLEACERLVEERGLEPGSGDDNFDEVFTAVDRLAEEFHFHGAYLEALVTVNSLDAFAQARKSELDSHRSRLQNLDTRITAWLGSLDVERLLQSSKIARAHEHHLRRKKILATKLMSPAEEALASKLGPTGGSAWSRLHGNVTSVITATVELPGGARTLPMTQVRGLALESDRDVRRSAYEAELDGWKANEVVCAAAMNSIKGEVAALAQLRGWASPLARSLFSAAIDQETLEAMMAAAKESFPDFRRYLRAKAKAIGVPKLAWYDLFAPVGEGKPWSFSDAEAFVERQFRSYSGKLGDFAVRSFRESWIDAEPRAGKQDGAYCEHHRADESRVFMNYKEAFGSVTTLAHELGHAYHNLCLAPRTMTQRETPMTLAETASIFCETILMRAALAEASDSQSLGILEGSLQDSCQVVVDITSRFLFESAMFADRRKRELSPQELCDRMLEAQKATYGDGLDENLLHPYMWAAKPHYYSAALSFYNYPYMFGLLFGLGLYAVYEKEPQGFQDRYDNLLSRTGMADAATLASEFGIDIRLPDFWRGSLDIIRLDIDRFVEIVG